MASALDYAHRRRDADSHDLNIVHRDVSPQNILISYEGDIKLCDFGIAKAASKASKTQSGALKGKIQYMSPEQAWGKPIDRRSDLFSLGVVLHEMLTGERLFRGDTDMAVLEKVRSAEVLPPSRMNPEVPTNLDAVVLKALAKDPDERYANASDLLRDLDSVLYSYTPAPGSADLAIYLHRLQAEETSFADAKAREAAANAERAAEPQPPVRRKSKGAPISRRTAAAPRPAADEAPPPEKPPAPAPPAAPPKEPPPRSEVFGSLDARTEEAEKKSRAPLFAAIGVAAVVLAGFAAWKLMKPAATAAPVPRPPVATPAAAPEAVPTAAAEAAPAVPTAAPIDAKAVEAEVQRQLAAKRKELEKAAAAKAAAAAAPEPTVAAPELEPTVELPEPTAIPPTAVPTVPPPTAVPTVPPPPTVPPVRRGDLVGPGDGVVEPALLTPPRVAYPPIARQRHIEGRVVVMVLVDENGDVAESRLQQGISGAPSVNEAVLAGVKSAKFRPATKNGIPVKMWRPVLIEVKP